jgi:cyclase
MLPRVIPCLLVSERGLHKTRKFADSRYVGDPINAVHIFNEKEVDEIIVLRTDLQQVGGGPRFAAIRDLASECFMPLAYGGGVRTLADVSELLALGVEKVVLNTAAIETPALIREAAERFGSQAVVVACDVKRSLTGAPRVYAHAQRRALKESPVDFCRRAQELGAGEIFLNSVDRDGTQAGYDLPLVRAVAQALTIPVIAAGGAGSLDDVRAAIREAGASAAAAGSLFVFHGKHRAVLITYPARAVLDGLFGAAPGGPAT